MSFCAIFIARYECDSQVLRLFLNIHTLIVNMQCVAISDTKETKKRPTPMRQMYVNTKRHGSFVSPLPLGAFAVCGCALMP
jgi:hypothetical protein